MRRRNQLERPEKEGALGIGSTGGHFLIHRAASRGKGEAGEEAGEHRYPKIQKPGNSAPAVASPLIAARVRVQPLPLHCVQSRLILELTDKAPQPREFLSDAGETDASEVQLPKKGRGRGDAAALSCPTRQRRRFGREQSAPQGSGHARDSLGWPP